MDISQKEELLLTIITIVHYYCYYPIYYSILFFHITKVWKHYLLAPRELFTSVH